MEEIQQMFIPFGYREPTEEEIKEGKDFIVRRERVANALAELIDELLKQAAENITKLCYKYNVDPYEFQITSSYNEKLFEQIAMVLDELEDEIMDLILEYSTKCTNDKDRRSSLIAWILLLGRNNKTLQQTLEKRLFMFSRDLEAMVVAVRLHKMNMTQALTRIKSNIHAVYVMPEVVSAIKFADKVKATYIRSKGVKHGNVGSSNSEANNILRFGKLTSQMSWMRNQLIDFRDNGASGFYQLRGSDYICDICDEQAHFYDNIDEMLSMPYPHAHCQCFRIPIYKNI